MDEQIRRAVAYAAAGRINGKFSSSIYSHDRGCHSSMAEGYDYESGSHLGGAKSGNMYHYGLSAHVSLNINGQNFSGYDYESGSHFSGHVSGSSIQLYDYNEGQYFQYSI